METTNQKALLYDNTLCMGCRGCQVACKQWNNLKAEETTFFGGPGYQNPKNMSGHTYTLIKYHEVVENDSMKNWVFWKNQCQHCLEPACIDSCLVGALHKEESGAVAWNSSKCIGCRYCMISCAFDVPKYEWDSINPEIRKCNLCFDRIKEGLTPSCAKTCPTGAILFGDREELLSTAEKRLAANPEKYYQHIYGKEEVGGTGVLSISRIPLEDIGYPKNLTTSVIGSRTAPTLKAIPMVVVGLGAVLGITALIADRKNKVAESKKDKGGKNE